MKRFLALIFALILVFTLMLAFSSCSFDDLDTQIEDMSEKIKDQINDSLGGYLKEDPMFKE